MSIPIKKIKNTLQEISNLDKITVTLGSDDTGKRLYKSFSGRHPKLIIIQKKSIGVALIDLSDFSKPDDYVKSVNGKNSAAYFSRKAVRAGFDFRRIDPNKFIDEIFKINTSASGRQGREMDDSYKKKITSYPIDENNLFYGVFKENKLMAYLWIVSTGELAVMNRILGHADFLNDGIMYLLVTSFISELLKDETSVRIVMYDTFFGATDGLKMFKTRCGFTPYKVNWKIK